MPPEAAASRPSAKGKNASEATTAPSSDSPAFRAFDTAISALSIRDICPAPIPSVARPLA